MIKEGQIYESEQYGGLYVVTRYAHPLAFCVFTDGWTTKIEDESVKEDKFITEYPTWHDAINGKEFNDE